MWTNHQARHANAMNRQTEAAELAHVDPQTDTADNPPLIFVTGASRSGTTMLARMLGAHSKVLAFDELHYFGALWDPFDEGKAVSASQLAEMAAVLLARHTHGLWGGEPTEVEQAWGRRLVRDLPESECTPAGLFAAVAKRLAEDAGKSSACEQTPRNIFYARRLLEIYPHARIVHIVRDPRAVLASQKNRWKLRRLGAHHLPLSEMIRTRINYHPLTMSQLWLKANEAAAELAEHPRFTIVRFEDLAADPEGGARRLCAALDLAFEPNMLEIPRWGSSNVSHTKENTGVSREVVDQWRRSVSKGEARLCEKITHRMMQRFGYTPEFHGHSGGKLASLASLATYPVHVAGVMAFNPGRALIQLKALVNRRRGMSDAGADGGKNAG